ncbi:MAG: nitronate monooxygenase [Burkholderiales bacterium]|nr:nitronate monooxygenase [Burkholderiales bacterium]
MAAPMLRVSGIELVSAACRAGVIGSFPTPNARSPQELEAWLTRLNAEALQAREAGRSTAPYCPNLIMRREPAQLRAEAECFVRHRTELVLTSVGSPAPLIPLLHDGGCLVFADVASLHHAQRAVQAGVDGLVLLTAGAGGQTGWLNPFAFVRAVRGFFDGPIALSGGLADGVALRAAQALGCDLGLMGTRFIATRESLAAEGYRQMLVDSSIDDIHQTRAFTGLPTNFLRPSIVAAGLDPATLPEGLSVAEARARYGGGVGPHEGPRRWSDVWSAGHTVSGVHAVQSTAELVDELEAEYLAACSA